MSGVTKIISSIFYAHFIQKNNINLKLENNNKIKKKKKKGKSL